MGAAARALARSASEEQADDLSKVQAKLNEAEAKLAEYKATSLKEFKALYSEVVNEHPWTTKGGGRGKIAEVPATALYQKISHSKVCDSGPGDAVLRRWAHRGDISNPCDHLRRHRCRSRR